MRTLIDCLSVIVLLIASFCWLVQSLSGMWEQLKGHDAPIYTPMALSILCSAAVRLLIHSLP